MFLHTDPCCSIGAAGEGASGGPELAWSSREEFSTRDSGDLYTPVLHLSLNHKMPKFEAES